MGDDDGDGKVVLVVDDRNDNRTPLVTLLRREGFTVLEAASGTEALELYTEQKGEIDILISDMAMPGMDGFELLAALQLRSQRFPECRITKTIAWTAYGKDFPPDDTAVEGFDEHAEKPPTFDGQVEKTAAFGELLEKIRELLAIAI
jgi:CheY-like chemotaxis protein